MFKILFLLIFVWGVQSHASTTRTIIVDTLTTSNLSTSYGMSGATSATANAIVARDGNGNTAANSFIPSFQTIATAAGTTTFTVSTPHVTQFTGTSTQTVTLPVVSTLVLGRQYLITNRSTGAVTVNSSGSNLVQTINAGQELLVTCVLTSGTTAASWDATLIVPTSSTGAVLETPSGTVNGSNTVFTLTYAPISTSTLNLFLNGVLLIQGTDYTISSNSITMTGTIPVLGQSLRASYFRY